MFFGKGEIGSDKEVSSAFGPSPTVAPTTGRTRDPCFSRLVTMRITSSIMEERLSCLPRGCASFSTTMMLTRPSFSRYAKPRVMLSS